MNSNKIEVSLSAESLDAIQAFNDRLNNVETLLMQLINKLNTVSYPADSWNNIVYGIDPGVPGGDKTAYGVRFIDPNIKVTYVESDT